MSAKNCDCEDCQAPEDGQFRRWAEAGAAEPAEGQDGRLTLWFEGGARLLAAYQSACNVLGTEPGDPIGSAMLAVIAAAQASLMPRPVPQPAAGRRSAPDRRNPSRLRMVRGRSS